jgi:hypothetical protein
MTKHQLLSLQWRQELNVLIKHQLLSLQWRQELHVLIKHQLLSLQWRQELNVLIKQQQQQQADTDSLYVNRKKVGSGLLQSEVTLK